MEANDVCRYLWKPGCKTRWSPSLSRQPGRCVAWSSIPMLHYLISTEGITGLCFGNILAPPSYEFRISVTEILTSGIPEISLQQPDDKLENPGSKQHQADVPKRPLL